MSKLYQPLNKATLNETVNCQGDTDKAQIRLEQKAIKRPDPPQSRGLVRNVEDDRFEAGGVIRGGLRRHAASFRVRLAGLDQARREALADRAHPAREE